MKTAQQIWDEHIYMDRQDMRDYMPFLREIAKGAVLEIGVRGGVSTSAFLLGMDDKDDGSLFSIDIDESCGSVLAHSRWTFFYADSQLMDLRHVLRGYFDTVLIDGDHSYHNATSDIQRFSPLVRHGGTLLMHDVLPSEYTRMACPEIDECRQAWDEFCTEHQDWNPAIMPGLFGMGVAHRPA